MPPRASVKPTAAKKVIPANRADRAVVYPKVDAKICIGKDAITMELAKDIMGWEELDDKAVSSKAKEVMLLDHSSRRIFCGNNIINRPIYGAVYKGLAQEILNRRWKFNGEPIILGKTGLVLNGQHTLIGLILACQEWQHGDKREHWKTLWPEMPTIEKMINVGIEETDDVVNTMDTCKPRSLSDVIYRSEYFAKMSSEKRREASRICDYAIRFLWLRTGSKKDPYAPVRTHSESLDFIERHKHLLRAVRHIMDEEKPGKEATDKRKISRYIPIGKAAGLLYLMAASGSNGKYAAAVAAHEAPSEKLLQLDKKLPDTPGYPQTGALTYWDKACEFFTLLATQLNPQMKPVVDAMASPDPNLTAERSVDEKVCILCKAWQIFIEGKKIPQFHQMLLGVPSHPLHLQFHVDENGINRLIDDATCGGIDIGSQKSVDQVTEDKGPKTPEEMEAAKLEQREKREKDKAEKGKAKLRQAQGGGGVDTPSNGDGAHIEDTDDSEEDEEDDMEEEEVEEEEEVNA